VGTMGRDPHVSFSLPQQGDAIGVPLAAWLASRRNWRRRNTHWGFSRSQWGRYV